MNDFTGLYDIRDLREEDKAFIYATFLRGLYYGDSWFSLIPKQIFMENYKPVIETLLKRSAVMVACLKEDPSVILGYSIMSFDFQTIHWVHVKSAWREKGIARSLLPQYPASVSHLNKLGRELITKFPNTVFNPFKLT